MRRSMKDLEVGYMGSRGRDESIRFMKDGQDG